MEKKFIVEGMSCANCALSIEKNLNNKKGITSVNVSLMGKSMVVSFDENIISSKNRALAGMTAPPEGLYLNRVDY